MIKVENLSKNYGTVEAVKTVSDLFMPVSGSIQSFNEKLEDTPEIINEDPYGEGWIIKIDMEDPTNTEGLLSAADYQALVTGS